MSLRELYALGLVVHAVMLLVMLTLPGDTAWKVLGAISLPVILINPVATAALGGLMVNRLRRRGQGSGGQGGGGPVPGVAAPRTRRHSRRPW